MPMQYQIPTNMNRIIIIINWLYPISLNSESLDNVVIHLFQLKKKKQLVQSGSTVPLKSKLPPSRETLIASRATGIA